MGIFRQIPFREAKLIEIWRGPYAQGVRGYIDPFEPGNPYGPRTSTEIEEF